jgi:transposase
MERTLEPPSKELHRRDILLRMRDGGLTGEDAARLLGISPRQLRRLRAAYASSGAAALAHGNRGRRPANAIDLAVADRIRALAASAYRDLSVRRLTAALAEEHGISVSRASVHRIVRDGREPLRTTVVRDADRDRL